MTLQEQLKAGEIIFQNIDSLGIATAVYEYIRTTSPPAEWVEEFTSLLDEGKKYKTMKIELVEAVASRIFPGWHVSNIAQPTINVGKDKVCVTLVATVKFKLKAEENWHELQGIATEVAHNMAILPLAAPKALAMVKKQAFKQLGDLFGLSLSREMEGEATNLAKQPENELVNEAIIEIEKCKTLDEVARVQNICDKSVQSDVKFTAAVIDRMKLINLKENKDARK
jgi:hypothetical protein